jgi:hypothetical protein
MNASDFYNENLEKEMLAIIKFFYKFYANKITDVHCKVISKYIRDYDINIFLLEKDISLKNLLLFRHTHEKSQVFENILKYKFELVLFINELDDLFRIVPKYNKKIVTYRGLHICNRYPIEPKLKNMVYELERSNIGKEFMFSTFLSTSLDPYIAIYEFAIPKWTNGSTSGNNKKYVNKLKTTCDDLFELFGKKYFLLMKINIPKGNKFLYLDIFPEYEEDFGKNEIDIKENEILLPRNSILKLVKRYDLTMKMHKPKEYSANNILKNKIEHENLPTRIYEFDYIGYEDTKQKIEFDVDLAFNQNKSYLKKIAKEVENEMKKK